MWRGVPAAHSRDQEAIPIPSERSQTMKLIRRFLYSVPLALGLVAIASGPASAGMVLNNHCLPSGAAEVGGRAR